MAAKMSLPDILSAHRLSARKTALATASFLIAAIAFIGIRFQPGISLGVLYLVPVLLAALFVSRLELFILAVACTVLREAFGPFERDYGMLIRSGIGLVAYFGSGLFVSELARRRRLTLQHLKDLQDQIKLREEAEEQLRILIETSPAAILTVSGGGSILLANHAAHQMLASEDEPLTGKPVARFFAVLADVPQPEESGPLLRTTLECRGRRRNGEVFPAHIWLSTYSTASGPRLAAIVLDTSEEVREREELGLSRLMASSRILVRAVSHEIRNACAAISVVQANLRRLPGVAENEDYRALGTLVEGLGQLVSPELRSSLDEGQSIADIKDVLDELRIIIEPPLRDNEVEVEWNIPEGLPAVHAERHGLLHVLMNLANNSQRALQGAAEKKLAVEASIDGSLVVVRVIDSGPGVARPEGLFQPFQQAADGAGLGLYLSRALIRSFAGELRYEPRSSGCCFRIELAAAQSTGAVAG